ncbi:hypothetical protein PVAP13_5KG238707 [Panicum virgatum]|uniref:Uncharacterized protein n=1 Tax=Panicum virgatum TaxID=38727 RepID=A0A8T0SKV4_PANVG|nr:hypothetical protein PVAP13_5KG238707 [Panicum virgatum]
MATPEAPRAPPRAARARRRPELRPPGHGSPEPDPTAAGGRDRGSGRGGREREARRRGPYAAAASSSSSPVDPLSSRPRGPISRPRRRATQAELEATPPQRKGARRAGGGPGRRGARGRGGRRRPGGRRRRAPRGSCREEAPGPCPDALEAAAAAMAPRGSAMAARRQRPLPLHLESLRPQPSSARQ